MPSNGLFPPTKRDRRTKIKKLETLLKASDNPQVTIAQFCLDESVSLRKVREYIRFLKLTGKIKEDVKI